MTFSALSDRLWYLALALGGLSVVATTIAWRSWRQFQDALKTPLAPDNGDVPYLREWDFRYWVRMHGDVAPPRAIRIRDPAHPAGILRRATLVVATAKADHPATAQGAAAITAMATAAIRAAAAAVITAGADLVVALAAPVQAAVVVMATAAGMETATAGAAMAEGMAVATEAAENADIIGIIPAPPMCRTMQFGS